jgi:hypothetical protein
MSIDRDNFLNILHKKFTKLHLKKGEEFGTEMENGIWLSGSDYKINIFNDISSMRYKNSKQYIHGLHKSIVEYLNANGWKHSMLDAETCHIYK